MSATRAVAVTGASGFIGGALCRVLAVHGWEVRALVREPERFVGCPACAPSAAICPTPSTRRRSQVRGPWCTAPTPRAETDLERARRVNEDGTRALLERSRRAGVPRMVFVSTVAAAADAPSYYGRSKHALEQLFDPARDAIVRPGLVVGPAATACSSSSSTTCAGCASCRCSAAGGHSGRPRRGSREMRC